MAWAGAPVRSELGCERGSPPADPRALRTFSGHEHHIHDEGDGALGDLAPGTSRHGCRFDGLVGPVRNRRTSVRLEALILELESPAILRDGANDVAWCAVRDLRLNFHHHFDLGVGQPGLALHDLLGNSAGVWPDAGWVQVNRGVKAPELRRGRRGFGC